MNTWTVSSWAMLRRAGFPFSMLEQLRDTAFAESMRVAAGAARGQTDCWAAPRTDFDRAVAGTAEALCKAGQDDRFLEAVYLSSPRAFDAIAHWVRQEAPAASLNSKTKRRVRTLMMYLQRLCAKNETASFFGPVSWIPVGSAAQDFAFPTPSDTLVNEVFWSHWAVQRIADLVSADPEAWPALRPRSVPWVVDRQDGPCRIDFLAHPPRVEALTGLRDRHMRARELCDGGRTIAEIADLLGSDDLDSILRELADRGAIELGITIPAGAAHPMNHLRARLGELPSNPQVRWRTVADELDARRADFEAATGIEARVAALETLNQRFMEVGAGETSRGHGQLACDRAIVFEDCRQDWGTASLSGPAVASLRGEFTTILELMFELPLARLRARRAECHRWFVDRFGPGAEAPIDRVLAAAAESDMSSRLHALDEEVRAYAPSALCDALYAAQGAGTVTRSMQWARDQLAGRTFDAWALCSADLHLDAVDDAEVQAGDFGWVVGEVHALHDVLTGPFTTLHPSARQFTADCARLHAALSDAVICEPVKPHYGKTSIRVNGGTPEIEFAARSSQTGWHRLGADELRIRDDGERLALWAPRHGDVELMVPPEQRLADERGSIFGCFTGVRAYHMLDFLREQPVDHLPRLRVGRFTVFRETWWVDPVPGRKAQNLTFDNQRLGWTVKTEHNLPDEVFVKFAEEPKPIFVDFRNPLLVDLFARGLVTTEHRVAITEMLPSSRRLWLNHGLGGHTNEFRIGFYRRADR